MTPERWKHAQELLDRILEKPLQERAQALESIEDSALRREVRSFIHAIETVDTSLDHGPRLQAEALAPTPPTEAGSYRLVRPIGEGGMGAVYLAERLDQVHHKQVAVKLSHGGFTHPELEQRFRSEREILAHLEHPYIARLLDGGATSEGRPYLVMEYVEGEPIDHFCDRQQLSIHQRLVLFHKVCEAVQYAHRNLVVHRDLKPGNILVTEEGEPKLLDFGIAKLLNPDSLPMTVVQTRTGGGPMTPAYASPEQLTGQTITTASDVYSLGILLYELLTGRRPYKAPGAGKHATFQQLSGDAPTLPSQSVQQVTQEPGSENHTAGITALEALASARQSEPRSLQKQLRGDLDSIALKALASAPEDRYASAEQLADDLQRHLEGLPVRAREGTLAYRTEKFIRRHRWAVASTSAVFVVLVALVLTLLSQQREVHAQSQRAETTAEYLSRLFYTIDPISGSGNDLAATDLLDLGRDRIDQELAGLPRVQGNLLAIMGRAYYNLGDLDNAEGLLDRALTLRLSVLPSDHIEVAESERLRCMVLDGQARFEEAEAACRRSLQITQAHDAGPNQDLEESLYRLARVLVSREGGQQEADELFRKALAMARQLEDRDSLSQILNSYAGLEAILHHNQEALGLYQEALDIVRQDMGEDHPRLGAVLTSMGKIHSRLGDQDLAIQKLQQAHEQQRRIYRGSHPILASTLYNLGLEQEKQGVYEAAENSYLESLEMYRQHFDPSHPHIANVLARLATLYASLERLEQAESLALEALRIRRLHLGSDSIVTANSCDFLAGIYRDLKRFDEAEALYQEALSIYRRAVGEKHQLTASSLSNYATFLSRRQQWEPALPLYQQALSTYIELNGPETREVSLLTFNLGRTLHRLAQLEAAEKHYRTAIDTLSSVSGSDHPILVVMKSSLGHLQLDSDQLSEAEALSRQALELAAEKLPNGHRFGRAALQLQGRIHFVRGETGPAEEILRPLFETVREKKGLYDNETRDLRDLLIQLYRQTDRDNLARDMERLHSSAE